MQPILANVIGPDLLIVIAVVALLFGGSQLPKLARSLGSAKREFEHGLSSSQADVDERAALSTGQPPAQPIAPQPGTVANPIPDPGG
ncbi:MAG: Sec-independent protein translocase subunit TatA/TatB [Acidimicrobiales bacterium]